MIGLLAYSWTSWRIFINHAVVAAPSWGVPGLTIELLAAASILEQIIGIIAFLYKYHDNKSLAFENIVSSSIINVFAAFLIALDYHRNESVVPFHLESARSCVVIFYAAFVVMGVPILTAFVVIPAPVMCGFVVRHTVICAFLGYGKNTDERGPILGVQWSFGKDLDKIPSGVKPKPIAPLHSHGDKLGSNDHDKAASEDLAIIVPPDPKFTSTDSVPEFQILGISMGWTISSLVLNLACTIVLSRTTQDLDLTASTRDVTAMCLLLVIRNILSCHLITLAAKKSSNVGSAVEDMVSFNGWLLFMARESAAQNEKVPTGTLNG
ncbi:uncharacterized protein EAF01_001733 [Botrytis porri]|uniref:Sodium/calcium exchanger membrane region domain-containing protein n=1 Tax=Botrytis porri TaxID=87229 RepID=A0A4Z1KGQ5_9HELO|nr:uncharacterized protein EAF01_001733 [Botrytis porri]KAF7912712.1 hypothetical protein EAF01_001733 [Botrytis porri]TGO84718.1 hypothetical protein BPOR_0473g00020 [Botrytis porri]